MQPVSSAPGVAAVAAPPSILAPLRHVSARDAVTLPAYTRRLAHDRAEVEAGILHPWSASAYHPARGQTRGVVLLVHGFTAGPWQFHRSVEALTSAGLDVYTPRMPGHGHVRHGRADPSRLPGPNDRARYHRFANEVTEEAFAAARARGVPLQVLGFSLGGAVALDIACSHPDKVSRLMMVAPLVRVRPLHGRLAFAALHVLQSINLGERLMRRRPFSWGKEPPPYPEPLPAYWTFPLGKLYGCIDYAAWVRKRLTTLPMPVQLVASECDAQCDPHIASRLQPLSRGGWHFCIVDKKRGLSHSDLAEHLPGQAALVAPMVARFFGYGVGVNGRV